VFFVANLFARKKGRKSVEKGKKVIEKPVIDTTSDKRNEIEPFLTSTKSAEGKKKRSVRGCKMILCEDPLTGDVRAFPVECPEGYIDRMRSKMREKGVRFSSKPLPEEVVLIIPEEEL